MSDNGGVENLSGYHHLTMVCSDARENVRFYRDVLGLRLVKKTVNFDMPETYHLYYGDYNGSPGTLLTFFEWPNARPGNPGWGGAHHIALSVASGPVLAYWRGRLERSDVEVEGPFLDHGFPAIRFRDPDGLIVELCAPLGEDVPDGAPDLFVPAMAIGAAQHAAIHVTNRENAILYYRDLLGFGLLEESLNHDDPSLTDLAFLLDSAPGSDSVMRLHATLTTPDATPRARDGAGQTHHLAFGVPDDATELAWRERIGSAAVPISDVRDRSYFHSIYFNDPDGCLLEIATANPGFATDEPLETLGQRLSLPSWLEERREQLERRLAPID
ncbi:MAG TPA: VOC family protein [Thermomicrobiales bacterium]|nr:VOC family protein [Thermomicrobiales bacterium]